MVQDLLNVIEQLQNHLLTQHEAITQEHPDNMTESDEGDDYIEGPLMVSIHLPLNLH